MIKDTESKTKKSRSRKKGSVHSYIDYLLRQKNSERDSDRYKIRNIEKGRVNGTENRVIRSDGIREREIRKKRENFSILSRIFS